MLATVIKQIGYLMKRNARAPREAQLQSLAGWLEASREPFDDEAIAHACWGLQRLRPGPATDRLCRVVADKTRSATVALSGKTIGMACYGLQSQGNTAASQALAQALADKIRTSGATLNSREIGTACYGLQSLGSSEAAQALAQALAEKIRTSRVHLEAAHLGMAGYGLQSLGSSAAAQALAQALVDQIRRQPPRMTARALGQLISGVFPDLASSPLAAWAMRELPSLGSEGNRLEATGCAGLVSALVLAGLDGQVPPSLIARLQATAEASGPEIASGLERNTRARLEALLSERVQRGLRFGHSDWGFEMDIFRPTPEPLNVEIDGLYHDLPTGRSRDARRDAFLAGRGVRVIRVKAADHDFDPGRIARTVRDILEPRPERPGQPSR